MILLRVICCDPPLALPSDIHANRAIRNEQLFFEIKHRFAWKFPYLFTFTFLTIPVSYCWAHQQNSTRSLMNACSHIKDFVSWRKFCLFSTKSSCFLWPSAKQGTTWSSQRSFFIYKRVSTSCLYCLCLAQRWRCNMCLSAFYWHYLKDWSSFSVLFLLGFFCDHSSLYLLCCTSPLPCPCWKLGNYKLPFWLPASPLRCQNIRGVWRMGNVSSKQRENWMPPPSNMQTFIYFQHLWMFNYQCVQDQVWSPINRAFAWECVHECELKVFLRLWILMNSK